MNSTNCTGFVSIAIGEDAQSLTVSAWTIFVIGWALFVICGGVAVVYRPLLVAMSPELQKTMLDAKQFAALQDAPGLTLRISDDLEIGRRRASTKHEAAPLRAVGYASRPASPEPDSDWPRLIEVLRLGNVVVHDCGAYFTENFAPVHAFVRMAFAMRFGAILMTAILWTLIPSSVQSSEMCLRLDVTSGAKAWAMFNSLMALGWLMRPLGKWVVKDVGTNFDRTWAQVIVSMLVGMGGTFCLGFLVTMRVGLSWFVLFLHTVCAMAVAVVDIKCTS